MSDFTRLTRSEWLGLADRFYADLDRVFDTLSPEDWGRGTPYLGWTSREVLAHMTSAMPMNFREVLNRALEGNPAAPAEFDTFRRNAREVAERQAVPVTALRVEFRRELDDLLRSYRTMSDDDWERPAWFFVGRVNVRTLFLVQFADNLFHQRDIMLANGSWRGLDSAYADPMVDWFLREFRPATFRPARASDLRVTVHYRLGGPGAGEWTLTIADRACRMVQGLTGTPDAVVESEAEYLVAAALARAAPWTGRLARGLEGVRGAARSEETVARITGVASMAEAMMRGRIRVKGDRALVLRIGQAFWHFWERPAMTEENIALG